MSFGGRDEGPQSPRRERNFVQVHGASQPVDTFILPKDRKVLEESQSIRMQDLDKNPNPERYTTDKGKQKSKNYDKEESEKFDFHFDRNSASSYEFGRDGGRNSASSEVKGNSPFGISSEYSRKQDSKRREEDEHFRKKESSSSGSDIGSNNSSSMYSPLSQGKFLKMHSAPTKDDTSTKATTNTSLDYRKPDFGFTKDSTNPVSTGQRKVNDKDAPSVPSKPPANRIAADGETKNQKNVQLSSDVYEKKEPKNGGMRSSINLKSPITMQPDDLVNLSKNCDGLKTKLLPLGYGTCDPVGVDNPTFLDDEKLPVYSIQNHLETQSRGLEDLRSDVRGIADTLTLLVGKFVPHVIESNHIGQLPDEETGKGGDKKKKKKSEKIEEEGKAVFRPDSGEDDRDTWDSKLTFLLATVGYAVGLGNVWRFPYLAQKNGGGAFLIPYFVMLMIEGIPIFYLELAIGQRLRKGAIGVWSQVSPYLAGIGISSAVVSFNVALYYNTIIAWCLFYFVQSFQSKLPWAECPKQYFSNGSYILEPECVASTPTQYFWYRTTLDISPDINHPEGINYTIAFSLIIAWVLVYLCMIKGIVSSGKVVYVTATFPYIVLIIFFFRGITLKGMADGVKHLFTPKWYKLADPVVWLEAGTQIFFSLGLAFGGLIAFSSYNPANNNCYRDAVVVSVTNCLTSMFAGIVVFSIIGFKATLNYEKCLETSLNITECDLSKELDNSAAGTGLAFIIFTEAINQFPGAQFWAVIFFLMLFTLGIDSQFGTLEGVVTSVVDLKLFPNLRKEYLTGSICLLCCIISMVFAHGAGNYIFILFDNFSGNFPLLIIALFECIAVSYIYGLKRFADDIELMVGTRPGLYWLLCWKYLSPAAMVAILVASITELVIDGSRYDAWDSAKGETIPKEWPTWSFFLIGFLVLVSVIWIPLIAICRWRDRENWQKNS